MPQPASDDLAKGAPVSPEVELIRALSTDLALEIWRRGAPGHIAPFGLDMVFELRMA